MNIAVECEPTLNPSELYSEPCSVAPGITDLLLLLDWWRHREDLPYPGWYSIGSLLWDPPLITFNYFRTLLLNVLKELHLALQKCNRQDRHCPFHPAKHLAGKETLIT